MKNIFLFVCLLSVLMACRNNPSTPVAESSVATNEVTLTESQLSNADMRIGPIEQKAISSLLTVNGKIDVPPTNMVSVCVPMGGYLQSTTLLEGMHIRKGEIIAIMEDQQYIQLQQDYLTAKAYFSSLEKEFQRQKDLNETKTTSDKLFEKAQAEYLAQKILIKSLSEKLKLIGINPDQLTEAHISRTISIHSPIDGFVSSIKMNVGKYVNPTDVLFELVNPTDIHLALTVFEKDIDKLFIGQKIIAYNNHQPDKKYECEIILIGKDISPERAITVHCHFEQYDKSLLPGMYMNAEIEVSTHKAYVIPNEGLVRFEGK
jgi:membrane fusion protein, heavy metal efflux system